MLQKFKEHYEPAPSLPDADELMTTQEIKGIMDEFYPEGDITITELFEALQAAGFDYTIVNCEYKWMLKEKQIAFPAEEAGSQ
jgi:hypothetical protein